MEKYHFCSVVTLSHIVKAIALGNSINSYSKNYCFTILCMDDDTYKILSGMNWNNVKLIKLEELEDEELLRAKSTRNSIEYSWTLKAALLYYVMLNNSETKYFGLLDADLYFYSDPAYIFKEAPNASLFVTEHNNSNRFIKYDDLTGRFNSGFVGCRNDENALSAIKWWRSETINWCYAIIDPENKKFGDQRYLEEWPNKFLGVHVLKSKGMNAAHWNIENYKLSQRNNEVFVDKDRLVFYHFSGLGIYNEKEYNLSWVYYLPKDVVELIYLKYVKELYSNQIYIKNNYSGIELVFPYIRKEEVLHYLKL